MIVKETLKGMLKPKNSGWRSSITQVEPNQLTTRGFSQEDLIGNISFPEMVYLLLKGELPSKTHAKMFEAVMVAFCDHGTTPPSTQSARLMASAGSPVNACIAGGILAFGENHAGAIEHSMKILQEGVKLSETYQRSTAETAMFFVEEHKRKRKKFPGFGHRYHTEDPRARKLLKVAQHYNCNGKHMELAIEMERTFVQDLFYNRFLHPGAGVPVPGTYLPIEIWQKRFGSWGTQIFDMDLGIDIPVNSCKYI